MTYVRRPTDSDAQRVAVAVVIQLAILVAAVLLCRLVGGEWWPRFMWVLLAATVVSIAWGLCDRALARRQFDRQESI